MKNFGVVETLGKYDLDNSVWRNPISNYETGRSFSFATYDIIKNNDSDDFNYIIIARGSRLEDHSKDFSRVKDTKADVDKIINYLKTRKNNYFVKKFLMDADAPIKEDALFMARYVDTLACNINVKTINLIGLSKCGAMNFYVPKYFTNIESFKKTNVFTIAPPFTGTKMASPNFIYSDIKNIITSKLGENKLSDIVSNKAISIYEGISSNSHMDYDIALPNGIPDNKLKFYDSSFIENMFSKENIDAITKVKLYKNFVTGIDDKTLKEAIKTCNFNGIGLCIIDDIIFNKTSDGMVPIKTQSLVESYIDTKSYKLESSHHDVMTNKRVINEICFVVDDTINEQKEIEKSKIKVKGQ